MNERIRQLAEQAGINMDAFQFSGTPIKHIVDESLLKKFAELIVEECRYVMDCNKGSDQNPVWNQALSETSEKIKQHFGVEE